MVQKTSPYLRGSTVRQIPQEISQIWTKYAGAWVKWSPSNWSQCSPAGYLRGVDLKVLHIGPIGIAGGKGVFRLEVRVGDEVGAVHIFCTFWDDVSQGVDCRQKGWSKQRQQDMHAHICKWVAPSWLKFPWSRLWRPTCWLDKPPLSPFDVLDGLVNLSSNPRRL